MRRERHLVKLSRMIILLSIAYTTACSGTDFVSSVIPDRREAASVSGDAADSRRRSATNALNSIFRLQKPSVGLAQFKKNEVPVISPIAVHNDDIIFQIFRCDSHTQIQGVFEEFDPDHPTLSTPDSAMIFFTRNKFWNDIEQHCIPVSVAHPQTELIDSATPSGNWRWFVRPCLPEKNNGVFTCSPVVAATDSLDGYRNGLNEYQQELLKKISQKIRTIAAISASFPEKSRNLLSELDRCSLVEWDKAKRSLIRSIALNIVGLGSSIVFEIFGPNGSSEKSWSEKLNIIWQPPQDVKSNGQSATRLLLWLFTNQHDFKEVCSVAEEIRISAAADVLKIKALQIDLSSDLDEAERLGLPLPSELKL